MTSRTNARTWAKWMPLAAPLVLLAWMGWAQRHMIDDGFIYLRVVKEIRAGHGPVFNVGQRVEAFTGPKWVAVLTIGSFLPFKLEWVAVASDSACRLQGSRWRSPARGA